MAKLKKRTSAFPGHPMKMVERNFHAPQRKIKRLKADDKPELGVSQPMPKRA